MDNERKHMRKSIGLGLNKYISYSPETEFVENYGEHNDFLIYVPLNELVVNERLNDMDMTFVTEEAKKWAKFPRQNEIFESIKKIGLQLPITVKKFVDWKINKEFFKFVCSGARIQYAVENEFTHIIGCVAKDDEEVMKKMVYQAKQENKFIDEKFVDKWWQS